MAWKFDPANIDIVWVFTTSQLIESGSLDLGSMESDLSVDTGDRTNDTSIVDQGLRVVDGNI